MTSLHELQRDMTAALLGRGAGGVVAAMVTEDGIAAEARLLIYRHHVVTTLTAALRATFPVVCRLVDERFFGYAADEYIRQEPPAGPCLFEYGETFPEFLEAFRQTYVLPDQQGNLLLIGEQLSVSRAPQWVSAPARYCSCNTF